MQTMGTKDTWTILKYLLGFPIAFLLAHLSIKNGPLHRSIDVHECLLNGSSDYSYCYKEFDTKDGRLRDGQKAEQMNRHCEKCSEAFAWKPILDDCVLQVMKDLERKAEVLVAQDIPEFVSQLSSATMANAHEVTESPLTVRTIVEILVRIADISKNITINKPEMEDVLKTVDILVCDESIKTWKKLNNGNMTAKTGTKLLGAMENISSRLTDDSFTITETFIELHRTLINSSFSGKSTLPNSNTEILIQWVPEPTSLTIIFFTSLNNVLPTRENSNNGSDLHINGDVVVVKGNKMLNNISLTFNINNQSWGNPQCVFWNFSLDAWDSTGCEVKTISTGNETPKITCECNHTTSFSNLMSPFFIDEKALDYITYIGVAISLVSLILCLIIEAIFWWKCIPSNVISYMKNVLIVNMAFSLLIANICFIIGAAVVQPGEPAPVGPCSAVAFFMHFFYLAFFFWMLNTALFLYYIIVKVLIEVSKAKMMVIAFTVGYGVPLLIAVITVASTSQAGTYILEADVCWLNINESKTLHIFVGLALTIVAINVVILVVVGIKLPSITNQQRVFYKKHTQLVFRFLVIFTPILGLTWGFGIGTMVSADLGIHVVFALLNSLQGFFILVFGTLVKIRKRMAARKQRNNLNNVGEELQSVE